jgi:ribonuclease P protein subunit POP4
VKLHRLWIGYMSELLALSPRPSSSSPPRRPRESAVEGDVTPMVTGMPQAAGMHAKLVKADFHGSIMTGQSVTFVALFFFPSLKTGWGKIENF